MIPEKCMELKELEESVVTILKEKKMMLSTAESCTAGMLASHIMNVSGASEIYHEGYITYSDDVKAKILGVSEDTLKKYTAVSEQVAYEMVEGVARITNADAALSVTGYASGYDGLAEHLIGLVYIGCYVNGKIRVQEHHFDGERNENREYAVIEALKLLREELI